MIDLHVDTEAFRQEMEQVRHWLEMWLEQDHCSFVAEANAAKYGRHSTRHPQVGGSSAG